MKIKSVLGVPVKPDGSAFALKVVVEKGIEQMIEIPGSEFYKLSKFLLAASPHMPQEKTPNLGESRSYPISRYEIASTFPEGISLALHTEIYGRMSFGFDADTAISISEHLREVTERVLQDQSKQSH